MSFLKDLLPGRVVVILDLGGNCCLCRISSGFCVSPDRNLFLKRI